MSEENTQNVQVNESPVNAQPENNEAQRPAVKQEPELTPEAQQISTVLDAVKTNPGLVNDPEIAKIVELANGKPNPAAETKGEEPKTPESPFVNKNQPNETQAEPQKTNEVTETSVFLGEETQVSNQGDTPKTLEEVHNRINKKYNINTEQGVDKFFNSVDKWRKQAQQSSKTEKELNDIKKSFDVMPQPLFSAFENWTQGKDWASELFTKDKFVDYSKDFSAHNQDSMIDKYFGEEYAQEDLEDMDSAMKNKLSKIAEKQYIIEQNAYQESGKKLQVAREVKEQALEASVEKSLNTLTESFPEFSQDALTQIRQVLASNQVDALFKNKDGDYSEDAAKMIAFALYGDKENKRLMKVAKRQGESQATERLVSRGSDTPSVNGSQTNQPQGAQEVVKMFEGLFPKSTY